MYSQQDFQGISGINNGEQSFVEQSFVVRDENLPTTIPILEEYCLWEKNLELWRQYCGSAIVEIENIDTLFYTDCYYL